MVINGYKKYIKIVVVVLIISAIILLVILWNGIDLSIKEYQRITAICDNKDGWHATRIIDTKSDELEMEKKYGIDIKDGVNYDQYSLILSENYEVVKFNMKVFIHPNTCSRGDEKCGQIAICDRELGERYNNTIIIYIVEQKNIISRDEAEINYL